MDLLFAEQPCPPTWRVNSGNLDSTWGERRKNDLKKNKKKKLYIY